LSWLVVVHVDGDARKHDPLVRRLRRDDARGGVAVGVFDHFSLSDGRRQYRCPKANCIYRGTTWDCRSTGSTRPSSPTRRTTVAGNCPRTHVVKSPGMPPAWWPDSPFRVWVTRSSTRRQSSCGS